MTTFSDAAWDGSASNYDSTEAFCSACMVDENEPGAKKVQSKCHLPYKTASGAVSKSALDTIARVLQGSRGGVDIPADEKRKAARKTITLLKEAKMNVGDGLYKIAGMKPPMK